MTITPTPGRPTYQAIPGRQPSTAGALERTVAELLDLAEAHNLAAGRATTIAAWATATAAANGLLLAVAIAARIEPHQAQDLYTARTGAPPWRHHRSYRWTVDDLDVDDGPGWRADQLLLAGA